MPALQAIRQVCAEHLKGPSWASDGTDTPPLARLAAHPGLQQFGVSQDLLVRLFEAILADSELKNGSADGS